MDLHCIKFEGYLGSTRVKNETQRLWNYLKSWLPTHELSSENQNPHVSKTVFSPRHSIMIDIKRLNPIHREDVTHNGSIWCKFFVLMSFCRLASSQKPFVETFQPVRSMFQELEIQVAFAIFIIHRIDCVQDLQPERLEREVGEGEEEGAPQYRIDFLTFLLCLNSLRDQWRHSFVSSTNFS